MMPRQQAEHMIAIDPPVRTLTFSLAFEGPSTLATPSRNAQPGIAVAHLTPDGEEDTFSVSAEGAAGEIP